MKLFFYLLLVGLSSLSLTAQCNDPSYYPGPTLTFTDPDLELALLAADTSNNIGSYRKLDVDNSGTIEECEIPDIAPGLHLHRSELNSLGIGPISSLEGLEDSNLGWLSLKGMQDFTNNELDFLHLPKTLFHLEADDCNLSDLLNMQSRTHTPPGYSFRITNNPNLTFIDLTGYPISDFSAQSNFSNNGLTNIVFDPISGPYDALTNGIGVYLSGNNLSSVNFLSGIEEYVNQMELANNNFTGTLDLNNLINMRWLRLDGNDLQQVFIKNGVKEITVIDGSGNEVPDLSNNPNLQYVCTDPSQTADVQDYLTNTLGITALANPFCSFIPGGTVSEIKGTVSFDNANNNCASGATNLSGFRYDINDGSTTSTFISDNTGTYSIFVNDGTYTFNPNLLNPAGFIVSPASASINFPSDPSPFTQDFCVSPNGSFPQLQVEIIPTRMTFPGSQTSYQIVLRNTGNQIHSGFLIFNYDQSVLTLNSASGGPTSTTPLVWSFNNLTPFSPAINYSVTFTMNTPTDTPPLNLGDILNFSVVADDTTALNADATNNLRQTVVNSYDPNDKTCLQGDSVGVEVVDEFVDYVIRFENEGTAPAQNVVIRDLINTSQFDISTLNVTSSNYNVRTEIKNGNEVEFIFENINLPPSPPANRIIGYVAFEIKTLPTLGVGDSFENQADIYFDFNFPIVTNNFQTDITTLGTSELRQEQNGITIFPNPANDFIEIKSDEELKSVQVFDSSGRLRQTTINPRGAINISHLDSGIYIVKATTDKIISHQKLIKK